VATMDQESAAGSFEVSSGDGKTTTVTADRWDYDQNDRLQFWKDGKVVAVFRWWDSIKAKA
jgi:hypothetical protein